MAAPRHRWRLLRARGAEVAAWVGIQRTIETQRAGRAPAAADELMQRRAQTDRRSFAGNRYIAFNGERQPLIVDVSLQFLFDLGK